MAKRRKRKDPLRPMSQAELEAQADLLVASGISRPRQSIKRAQREAREQAEADARMIQGFSQALAGIVGRAGPAVEQAYGQATDRQQRIAQGYALGQQLASQGSADQANAILQQQGLSQRVAPGTGSQVTYALGGAVPSNLLNQIGLAATSTAHGYAPGVAGRGQQQLAQRLSQGQKEQEKLRAQMEDLMARVPGLRQEILDKLFSRELSKRATDIQAGYLGLAGNRETFDQSYDLAKLEADVAAAGAKAQGNQSKAKAKAREARLSALASNKDKAWSFAAELASRTKQVPGAGEQPNPPQPREAFNMLWSRYGQGLLRYAPAGHRAWWKRQVEEMIWGALTNNGFKRPPKQKPNRKITRPGPS